MTKKERILKDCFEEVIWMAIRYAHGRHTFAPTIVRDAIKNFQDVFPEWEPKKDITIKPPEHIEGFAMHDDYLDDLFINSSQE